jgi:hypothetical protein
MCQIKKKKRLEREFTLNAIINKYIVKDIMLDFGFDVIILSKKSWELIGQLKLVYSPIQFPVGYRCKNYLINSEKGWESIWIW